MSNPLTAIIVDDEPSSLNALRTKLARHCPEIQLIGECQSAEEGIHAIEEKHPDVVFLDVEMPRMNGFVMLQQISNRNFELIFTTAYDHYAIEAIRISALDYLVKPIDVEELRASVERIFAHRQAAAGLLALDSPQAPSASGRIETLLHNLVMENRVIKRIAIPSLEGFQFIDTDTILYLEADSNYTQLHMRGDQKITVSKTLKDFEELLPPSVFIRIHHSFIINKYQVSRYLKGEGGQVVMSNGKVLDVARRKKDDFLKAFDKL